MSDTPDVLDEAEYVARCFHWHYERLAPEFGYETRRESAVQWTDVPEPNRSLMVAVAGHVIRDVLDRLTARGEAVVKAPGLSHGDELVRVDGLRVTGTQDAPTFNQEPVWRRLRRSVPERRCSTCDGRKVVEGHAWRRIDETTGFPARELLPCPACSVPENGDTKETQ